MGDMIFENLGLFVILFGKGLRELFVLVLICNDGRLFWLGLNLYVS